MKTNVLRKHSRRQFLLAASAGAASLMLTPILSAGSLPAMGRRSGRTQGFDLGWLFARGEIAGAERTPFDDSLWRPVDLPHDWSIEDLPSDPEDPSRIIGPFDREAVGAGGMGFSVGGEGWYRKHFHLPHAVPGRVEIVFEGVFMNTDIWLNGRWVSSHRSGYTPFAADLTSYLSDDGDNVLAVRVRNIGHTSRWYSGSGIYRHVWLDVWPDQARIGRWGVAIVTRRITDSGAEIDISTTVENPATELTLVSRVKDEAGAVLWEGSTVAQDVTRQSLSMGAPKLWTLEAPNLYTLETELCRGDALLDGAETVFGVRIVTFDSKHGMRLNGRTTKLRGGCIHHDHGLLGAAAFDAAEERKVALLKARGYNALRGSHNLFSPAFLRACDRQGMLVISEAFDVWHEAKVPDDFSIFFEQEWEYDLGAMVRSARNHPCIIMWSIGNEIPGRNNPRGVETQWKLANEVHRLDPIRPVTAGINGFTGRECIPSQEAARPGTAGVITRTSTAFLDVVGYNYRLDDYELDHERYSETVFYGSESWSKDIFAIWELTAKCPWLLGDFVWTAMDYLGEAGIGGSVVMSEGADHVAPFGVWPWINAYCGDIDLIGRQKGASYARDVVWGISQLEMVVGRPMPEGMIDVARVWGWRDEQPGWTWPGAEGKKLDVRVYTVGDRVELRLNNKLIGDKTSSEGGVKKVEFRVEYEAGKLEAIAFRDGGEIARRALETVGTATAVWLSVEHVGGAGRGDIGYIAVELVDAQGRLVPEMQRRVELSLNGPVELIAFGSANPRATGGFQATSAETWQGRALAVVRGTGKSGEVTIRAKSGDLRTGTVSFRVS